MKALNLENFYFEFSTKIEKNEDLKKLLRNCYNENEGKNAATKEFTKGIINLLISVFNEFEIKKQGRKNANRSGKYYNKEYYRIDLFGWKRVNCDIENSTHLNLHSWRPLIAVEHENDYKDWSDEVIKLLYIDCPLRVVIGYSDRGKANDEEYLKELCEIIDHLEYKKSIGKLINKDEEFCIILGNGNVAHKDVEKQCFDYHCYKLLFNQTKGVYDYEKIK